MLYEVITVFNKPGAVPADFFRHLVRRGIFEFQQRRFVFHVVIDVCVTDKRVTAGPGHAGVDLGNDDLCTLENGSIDILV